MVARYADLLADKGTFATMTIEEVLDARALPAKTITAIRERYLPD
jgi:hypothetical protein